MVYGALPARRYSEQSLGISSAGMPFRGIVRKPGSEPVPSIDGKHVNNLQRSESRLSVASVNTQPAVSAQRPITSFPITRASSTSQTQLRTSPIQHSYQSQQLSPYPYQPYGADGPYMHSVAYGAAPDPYYAYTGQPPVQPGYASPPYVGRGNVYPGGLVPNSLQRVVIPPSGSPAVAERPRAISKRRSTTSRKNRSCSICHKVFNRPSGLRIHMHTHTGEKPFICEWKNCGKRFSVRSNMLRHMLIHRREERRKKIRNKDFRQPKKEAGAEKNGKKALLDDAADAKAAKNEH